MILLLAAFVSVVVFRATMRRPVIEALTMSSVAFDEVLADVAEVENLQELQSVAGPLSDSGRVIEAQLTRIRALRVSSTQVAAEQVVGAQLDFVEAAQGTQALEEQDFSEWPAVSEALATALEALAASQAQLGRADSAAMSDAVFDTGAAVSAVEAVVASAMADNAMADVTSVISAASTAAMLDDLTSAGAEAAVTATELQTALSLLESSRAADQTKAALAAEAAFLGELSSLQGLAEDTLERWSEIDAALANQGAEMLAAAALPPAEAAAAASDLRAMRSNIDDVVGTAERKLDAWHGRVRRAKKEIAAGNAALTEYSAAFQTQLDRYGDLREATAGFTERIRTERVTFGEGFDFFYAGVEQREAVRTSMNELSPPDAMRPAHLALLAVIDDAIAAMNAAIAGTSEAQYCYFCSYKDTEGWLRFQSESERITDTFSSAVESWTQAVRTERANLDQRVLPRMPRL